MFGHFFLLILKLIFISFDSTNLQLCPNFEKVEEAFCFGLVRPSVCASIAKIKLQF